MAEFSRIRTFKGHEDVVNAIDVSYPVAPEESSAFFGFDMLVSGSNDCTLKLWDFREKKHSASFATGY